MRVRSGFKTFSQIHPDSRRKGNGARLALAAAGLSVALAGCSNDASFNPEPLDSGLTRLNIDPFSITVSGISSGGYMAQQFHLAHSERVRGVGLIGVGPYDCAQGQLGRALSACMGVPAEPFELAPLVELALQRSEARDIHALGNLRNDQVWMLHGEQDATVGRPLFDAAVAFYQEFVNADRITVEYAERTGHLWPTIDYGVDCESSDSPYLGNCGLDAAELMLSALYGYLLQPSDNLESLVAFDQRLAGGEYAEGLGETGYAYIPRDCQDGAPCSLHISLHGCNQHADAIGDTFAQHSGLNRWAESNRIVVLYPQTKASQANPMNPQGCWDWWGYSGPDYATVDGIQIEALVRMVNHIAGISPYDPDSYDPDA